MGLKLLLPGVVLVVAGMALLAPYSFTGPQFPQTPAEWLGAVFVLAGLVEMKLVEAVTG